MIRKIKLICNRVGFCSTLDEEAFFEWINKIPSISEVKGVGENLYLFIKRKNIKSKDLRNLIGLFYRYNIDKKQLAIFLNDKNKKWFLDYEEIFSIEALARRDKVDSSAMLQ